MTDEGVGFAVFADMVLNLYSGASRHARIMQAIVAGTLTLD